MPNVKPSPEGREIASGFHGPKQSQTGRAAQDMPAASRCGHQCERPMQAAAGALTIEAPSRRHIGRVNLRATTLMSFGQPIQPPHFRGFAKVSLYRVRPMEKSSDKDVPRRRPLIRRSGTGAVPCRRRARHSVRRSDVPSLHKKAPVRRHNRQS